MKFCIWFVYDLQIFRYAASSIIKTTCLTFPYIVYLKIEFFYNVIVIIKKLFTIIISWRIEFYTLSCRAACNAKLWTLATYSIAYFILAIWTDTSASKKSIESMITILRIHPVAALPSIILILNIIASWLTSIMSLLLNKMTIIFTNQAVLIL